MTRSILSELAKKERAARLATPESITAKLVMGLSEVQTRFVLDKRRLKLARCGRRAGKSYADIVYMLSVCQARKGANVLYLGITQSSAMEIIWQPLLDMLRRHKIVHRALPSTKLVMFPNGSKIKIFGADSENAKNRLRGVPYDLVIVDECGYVAEVDDLVDIVLPSIADYGGTICLTSSPSEILQGLFYEADEGKSKEHWSRYYWTMLDNPFFQGAASTPKHRNRAEEEMALACALKYGGDQTHPSYRREYLGEWVRDSSNLIYPYSERNLTTARPKFRDSQFVFGLDFGVATASAISVIEFSESERKACVVKVWKDEQVLIDDFAVILMREIELFKPIVIAADTGGLGKAFVQELVRRYHLPIRAADKREKETGQRMIANDLLSGYFSVLVPECDPLIQEWAVLTRNEDGKEPKKSENHCSDATLYGYRYIYNTHFASGIVIKPETEEEKMIRQLMESFQNERDEAQYL